MLFTRFALAALPILGSVFASPISPVEVEKRDALAERGSSIVTVVKNLQISVAGPIASISAGNNDKTLSQSEAKVYLTQIVSAINTAKIHTVGAKAKRDIEARQADDLNEVGTILAEVITDIVKAVEGIADDLKGFPLIGALIIDIDGGLNTLLLGVQIVLVGVVEVVQGLLTGVAGLLNSLGNGLLAGLLGL